MKTLSKALLPANYMIIFIWAISYYVYYSLSFNSKLRLLFIRTR